MNARIVSKIILFVSLIGASVSSFAGPVPPAGLTPDDVILNKGAVQNGKTFDVPGATITALTSNIIRAQSILVNGVPVSTQPVTGTGVSVYPATATIIAAQGIIGTTGSFTGIINGTTVTLTGIFNGATIHGSSMVITGTITGGNLSGTNTGDASIGTANGLSLSGQAFSMTTASTISTGTLRAFDFALFNNKLSPTGNGSALTGLTKTQVGLGNVLNLDQTDASNLSSGLVDPTLLGTGTPTSATYLRGDSFFATLNSTAVGLGQVTNDRQVKVADYTQKGALLVGTSTGVFTVLPPGNDGTIIQADSAQPTGYKFVTPPSSFTVYPATATAGFPKGGVASTWTVTGLTTLLGLTNGTTVHFSSGSFSGPLDAANLRNTNTGDVTIATANGLLLQGQALSLSTASATQTGALTSTDWARFNTATSTSGVSFANVTIASGTATNFNLNTGTIGGAVVVSSVAVGAVQDASIVSLSASKLTGAGTLPNAVVDKSSITAQGNAITGTGSLVKADGATLSSATVTTLNSTSVNAATVTTSSETVANLRVSSTTTWPDGNVQKVYGPFFNVKDFGATGNGTTNDAVAIQAALNAAATSGGVVFVPQGVYVVGAKLTMYSSTTIRGTGFGSVLKAKAGLNDRLLVNRARDAGGTDYNTALENLLFDMNGGTHDGEHGADLLGNERPSVSNVMMINPYDSLYLLTGSPANGTTTNANAHYANVIFDGSSQTTHADIVDVGTGRNIT